MEKNYSLTKKACYLGYIIQGVVNNLVSLLFVVFNAEPYGISLEKLGRLIFMNFVAQLLVDFLSVYFVPKFGYKKCVIAGQFSSFAGFVLLGILPLITEPYFGIIIAVLFLSLGSGLIEVLISPMIEALPSGNKAGSMVFLHSFYCWGQLITVVVTTFLLLLVGKTNWYILPFFWAVFPFVNTMLFSKAPILELENSKQENSGFSILKNKSVYLFLVLMLCSGATEIAMSQWSSFFVEVGFGVPKWLGDLLGPSLFAAFMGTGRLLYGIFSKKLPLEKSLLISSFLAVLCYVIVAFSNSPVLSAVGCAMCGFSVSIMWPGILSFVAKDFKNSGSAIFSILAMLGDTGCALGPWILAIISEWAENNGIAAAFVEKFSLTGGLGSMQFGFLISAVFPLIMVVLLSNVLLKKKRVISKNEM